MLYNVVERAKYGNNQINRIELPFTVDCCHGWESTSELLRDGSISKAIATKYKYIVNYYPVDWTEEELNVNSPGQYTLA